jgi:hypothetical protein
MPRAAAAHTTPEKWWGWILSPRGHGHDWAQVFHVGPDDRDLIWQAIVEAARDVPVSSVRDRAPYGVVCGVEFVLTLGDRAAPVATSWHYLDEEAAPRLVTAYPTSKMNS